MPRERMATANRVVECLSVATIQPPTPLASFGARVAGQLVALRLHLRLNDREQFWKIHRYATRIVRGHAALAQALLARVILRGRPRSWRQAVEWPVPEVDHPPGCLLLGV